MPSFPLGWNNKNRYVLLFPKDYPEHLIPHENFYMEVLHNNNSIKTIVNY